MNNKLFKFIKKSAVWSIFCALAAMGYGQNETAQQAVNRASQAYNDKWKGDSIKDWTGTGKIAITGNPNGPLDFTLTVKSNEKVKRVVKTKDGKKVFTSDGTDGIKSWHVTGPFSGGATGSVAHFIESNAIRAVGRLFDAKNALKDLGPADKKHAPESEKSKVIEAGNSAGKSTRYYIDNASSLITRLEFETGEYYTMFMSKKKYPTLASFVFSDYRQVNGIPTPFKISIYNNLTKIEEMTFTSVQYNTGVKDEAFVP
jgi:hypothetical protein